LLKLSGEDLIYKQVDYW